MSEALVITLNPEVDQARKDSIQALVNQFAKEVQKLDPDAQINVRPAYIGETLIDVFLQIMSPKFKTLSSYCVWVTSDNKAEGSHWGVEAQ